MPSFAATLEAVEGKPLGQPIVCLLFASLDAIQGHLPLASKESPRGDPIANPGDMNYNTLSR
jgi:hypothetical protein